MIDYSQCRTAGNGTAFNKIPDKYVSSSFKKSPSQCPSGTNQWKGSNATRQYDSVDTDTFVCSLLIHIPTDLKPPVLLYYRLTNFYQNHRRYVKSLDSDQLKGTAVQNSSLGACNPLDKDHTWGAKHGKAYYPCGLIANSIFNDTFSDPKLLNKPDTPDGVPYEMKNTSIAWASDKALYGITKYNAGDIVPPPNWALRYPKNYTENNPPPNLKEDEGFQVWMRTAGLPNFSKLAKRNDSDTMSCGSYQLDIDDSSCPYQCVDFDRLTRTRLRGNEIWWHKVTSAIYSNCHGRQKSFPWYCLRCRWRHLRCSWRSLHSDTSRQAKVRHTNCFRTGDMC